MSVVKNKGIAKGAKSQTELGRRLGCSQKAVSQYVNAKDGWRWGRGPWTAKQVGEIQRWKKDLPPDNREEESNRAKADSRQGKADSKRSKAPSGAPRGDGAGEFVGGPLAEIRERKGLANLELTNERAAELRFNREVRQSKYLLKEDVERERIERVHAVKGAMLAVADSGIAEAMRNTETDQEARDMLRGRMIEICQEFSKE
jgi:hypothetical protein